MSANIRHSSETAEFYTPTDIVERARYVLGGFDLDPATSESANRVVKAERIFTIATNGLLQPRWIGRVFLNPPGGLVDGEGRAVFNKTKTRESCIVTGSCGLPPGHKHKNVQSSQALFWRVLSRQWELNHATAALFVGFSLELLQSCQAGPNPPHHPLDFRCCIPEKRIPFEIEVDGVRVPMKDPTHSNILVFMNFHEDGPTRVQAAARFNEAFGPLGYLNKESHFA